MELRLLRFWEKVLSEPMVIGGALVTGALQNWFS